LRAPGATVLLAFVTAVAPSSGAASPAPQKQAPPPRPVVPGGADEIRVRADSNEAEKGHYHWQGFVDLQAGELRIQADQLDIFETDKPDGTKQRRLTAEGNVVLMRGEERLAGRKLEMDLDSPWALMEDAVGYVHPGVYVEARHIERVDVSTYRIEGAKFTSCAQPNPRWGFTASKATLAIDKKITASNVLFKVKSVPAFYLPYFAYPIERDDRSSGLLFPHFGYSSLRGFNVGTGLFWAMGRSLDQTLYADRYSKVGYGFGHEFRYASDQPSRGSFKTYVFKVTGTDKLDYDLDWNALQQLPGRFRATLNVRQYSDLLFQQQFQQDLNRATTRTRTSRLNIQGTLWGNRVQLLGESIDTFFGQQSYYSNRRLPSLLFSRSPTRIGNSKVVLGYDVRADYLGRTAYQLEEQVVPYHYYGRFDVAPDISRPFSTSFLSFTPRIKPRYTYYTASLENGLATGPALDRPLFEASVELRGPRFSRIFNTPGNFYAEKFKHVIGPEITWSYRSPVNDFTTIPRYDGQDQLLGTNQINYAIVQKLVAKRNGPNGKPLNLDVVTWRIMQTYYAQINDKQNEFDPNYSSAYFGPGGVPSHFSPVLSRLIVQPVPRSQISWDVQYDTNFNQLRSMSLGGRLRQPWADLYASWSRAKLVAEDPEARVTTRDTLRGGGGLNLPGQLTLEGSIDYDILLKQLLSTRIRARWGIQCCAFTVERLTFNYNDREERQFVFSIELANIGSIGNFMGADQQRALGLGGYR